MKDWLFSKNLSNFYVISLVLILSVVNVIAEVIQLSIFVKALVFFVSVLPVIYLDTYMGNKLTKKETN